MIQPGQTLLNKYRIERILGEGAAGQVWLATHQELNALFALKIVRKGDGGVTGSDFIGYEKRFQLEARLGAQLKHAHIVHVYDFERSEDLLVMRMEPCTGGNLQERIDALRAKGEQMPLPEALQIAQDVAQGLAELHRSQIVHRDLKPDNILIDAKGWAKIADLGLAQMPGGPSLRGRKSEAQPHPGTPGYMSPEHEDGMQMLPYAADVYQLGLVIFEMLTGRVCQMEKAGAQILDIRSDTPQWLDSLLARLLAENHKERPHDGVEVVRLLREGVLKAQQKAQAEYVEWKKNEEEKTALRDASGYARLESGRLIITLSAGVFMELIRIPAGDFLMGSSITDHDASDDEKPQHRVYLDEYWISKTPVTVAQFDAFVKSSGYMTMAEQKGFAHGWTGTRWDEIKGANYRRPRGLDENEWIRRDHPVTQVSWADALAMTIWLNERINTNKRKFHKENTTAVPASYLVHLPTEAQWEKASRSTENDQYPWGNETPEATHCNYGMNVKETTVVGKYSPKGDSPSGCIDMAGNVWEWVEDWYDPDYYSSSPAANPIGPVSGLFRVVRGGSWAYGSKNLRSAYRGRVDPEVADDGIGFRCAISA